MCDTACWLYTPSAGRPPIQSDGTPRLQVRALSAIYGPDMASVIGSLGEAGQESAILGVLFGREGRTWKNAAVIQAPSAPVALITACHDSDSGRTGTTVLGLRR